MAYTTAGDVVTVLGKLGPRLPIEVDVDAMISIAHANVVDALSATYPDGIPIFTGDGLEVARWAEAKLAAAEILELLRADLPTLGDAPARLRESADLTLANGVPGFPAGSSMIDDPSTPSPDLVAVTSAPRVSSFTPASCFPDPYDAIRTYRGGVLTYPNL